MTLRDRVVFITGAARGIGAGIATQAAARGARVVLCGLEREELDARAAELGDPHVALDADVTDQASVDAAVAETARRFGGIDVVVANAGIASYGTVEQADPDAWMRTVDVNLGGVFRTARATLPSLLERRGYFCVIASVASYAALPAMSAYCASKAAAEALAGSLRLEVAGRGVDVGSVHPSWIDTDLVREADGDLRAFREMRAALPWPMRKTTDLESCVRAITDGIERRERRIHVPREVGLIYWLRSVVARGLASRAAINDAASRVPDLEQEIAALGRGTSARTAAINQLPTKPS